MTLKYSRPLPGWLSGLAYLVDHRAVSLGLLHALADDLLFCCIQDLVLLASYDALRACVAYWLGKAIDELILPTQRPAL